MVDFSPWVYIVLLGVAAVLYGWLMPTRKGMAASKGDNISDVEITLEQYMAEIERDNQEIVELIGQMKQDTAAKQLAQQEQVTELRQRLMDNERYISMLENRLQQLENNTSSLHLLAAASAVPVQPVEVAEDPPAEEFYAAPNVRERYAELFELYDQGKSIDVVAKQTGMARGEVQLILQLARREESL